jgi:hypothetical protein
MRRSAVALALASLFAGGLALAQDDFLTDGEVTIVRDAQVPEKRVLAYLDFAQRRLDAVRTSMASGKSTIGRSVQASLGEYIHILEALEQTIEEARERRAPLEKALELVTTRGGEFLKYLQSIHTESSPAWKDYQFTLEEGIEMTRDQLELAAQGAYPEVEERTPPDLPGPRSAPKREQQEEGPPRKSGADR